MYIYLLLFLFLYIFLINHFMKDKKYIHKIFIASTITILFYSLFVTIKANEGYSVTESLPSKFYILNTYADQEYVYLLVQTPSDRPRLYRLNKSIELSRFLKKYNKLKIDGQDVIVKQNQSNKQNKTGLYIESVRKQLPPK